MTEYAVTWTDPVGVTRQLGRVTARGPRIALRLVYARHGFLPMGSVRVMPIPVVGPPPRRRRGFDDPVTARRAARLAHTPEARAKRRASLANRPPAPPAKPLTLGQRKWRDLMRRRKRINPRRATHDEG